MDQKSVMDLLSEPAFWIIAAWLIRELWGTYREKSKELTKSLSELALAVTELRVEIKNLKDSVGHIPTIRQDLNALHSKVREIEGNA